VPLKERIDEELRILSELSHKNVLNLEEVIDDPEHDWLYGIFEGMPGRQLMDWKQDCLAYSAGSDESGAVRRSWGDAVQAEGLEPGQFEVIAFQEVLARYLFGQLLEGLAYIHEQGIIHKDLKPDNLLLTIPVPSSDSRFVRLLDIEGWPQLASRGDAKAGEAAAGATFLEMLRRVGMVAKIGDFNSAVVCPPPDFEIYDAEGTQQFTPPECFLGSSKGVKGKPRDIWSMGCVLFIMLYGRCPFWEKENIVLQCKIMQGDLVLPKGGPAISNEVQEFIRVLMSNEAALRPTATAALQNAWQTIGRYAL
ncbi:unnamed protein product, partial [Polarella glacialis]